MCWLFSQETHETLVQTLSKQNGENDYVKGFIILHLPHLTKISATASFIFAYQIESWMFLTMIVNHKPILNVCCNLPCSSKTTAATTRFHLQ